MAPHPSPSTAPKALEIHQHPQLPPGQAGGQIPPPSASVGAERWGRPPMSGWLPYTQKGRGSGHAWSPFRPLTSKILPPDRYRPPTTENHCCNCNNVRVKIARPTLPRAAPRLLPWPIRYGSCFTHLRHLSRPQAPSTAADPRVTAPQTTWWEPHREPSAENFQPPVACSSLVPLPTCVPTGPWWTPVKPHSPQMRVPWGDQWA